MEAATENRSSYLSKPVLHFAALFGLVLMLMLNWSEAYRAFIYLNVLIVLMQAGAMRKERNLQYAAIAILSFPLVLSLLHMLAVGHIEVIKEVRHLWLAGFVCLSVLLLFRQYMEVLKPVLSKAVLGILVVYCTTQAIALGIFNQPYGTTKNPHYLALYSALGIPVALYLLTTLRSCLRLVLVAVLLSLGAFLLHTWSRPAWIAVVVSAMIVLLFLENRKRLGAAILILTIPMLLFLTNLAGFGDRVTDLALNIQKEERVVIWQDAWHMQQSSSICQWVTGHGLDSYQEDFKRYSRYRSLVNFNSPHNSFMEVTYTSGLLGLAMCVWLYYWIYRKLFRMTKVSGEGRGLPLLLMSVVTINLLFIMITIPFVSHYNMYTLAFIVGLIFYRQLKADVSAT